MGDFHWGGGDFHGKTPLLGYKNSKMSLKKTHNNSQMVCPALTTDKNQGHARICEIYEIYNN